MNKEGLIRELAGKIRDGYISYGEAIKSGKTVVPPFEEDIIKGLERVWDEGVEEGIRLSNITVVHDKIGLKILEEAKGKREGGDLNE